MGKKSIVERALRRFGYAPMPGARIKSLRVQGDRDNDWERTEGVERPERIEDGNRAYAVSSWVFACVDAIAITMAGIPVLAMRRTRDGSEELDPDHGLYRLMRNISPISDIYTTWEATSAFHDLAGNCYWDISQKVNGQPEAIYMLEPERVKIIPDKKTFIGGYIYDVNGKKIRFAADEIIHFKTFNPNSFYYGQSRLAPARMATTVDFYAQSFNKAFFKNGCAPEGALETEQSLSDEQFSRLQAQWDQRYQGAAKAHKTLILEGGLAYKSLTVAPKDMQFILQRKMSREEITAVFRVPPAIVGIYEYANYANADVQEKAFYVRTVLPRLNRILAKLNQELCPLFGPDVFLVADLSGIKVLQEDQDKLSQIYVREIEIGLRTINAVRAIRGEEPVPWGDVPPPRQTLGIGGSFGDSPESTAEKARPVIPGTAPKFKAARIGQYDVTRQMGAIYKPLKNLYGDLGEEMISWLKSEDRLGRLRAYAETTDPTLALPAGGEEKRDANRDRAIVAGLFAGFDWHTSEATRLRIEADFAEPYKSVYEKGARFGAKKLRSISGKSVAARRAVPIPYAGGKKEFELIDENILRQLAERRAFWLRHGLEENYEALLDILRRNYFDKWRQADDVELIGEIQKLFGYDTAWKAERTAKTETLAIGQRAQRDMFAKSQVRYYEWRHSGNPNGRENHMALDGTVVNIAAGERFQVGAYQAEGPGDSSLGPEESINCDCDTWPAVGRDGEYELPDELWNGD